MDVRRILALRAGTSAEQDLGGASDVLDIVLERDVEDVLGVDVQAISKVAVEAEIRRLVRTGHAGLDVVTDVVEVATLFGDRWDLRTWTDQAHLAAEDVDDLWKFIEAQLAEATTEAGVAWVVF